MFTPEAWKALLRVLNWPLCCSGYLSGTMKYTPLRLADRLLNSTNGSFARSSRSFGQSVMCSLPIGSTSKQMKPECLISALAARCLNVPEIVTLGRFSFSLVRFSLLGSLAICSLSFVTQIGGFVVIHAKKSTSPTGFGVFMFA